MILALIGVVLADDTEDIIRLLDATDDLARGESSVATLTMEVKTARYERSVTMKAWSKGTEKSLIVIESPAKEKGVATLKVDDDIWNYLPKVDRTMKIPAAMMGGAWMGSHITNDDIVKGSRMSEDYTAKLLERPEDGADRYVIELVPNPDAPVVWGKVVVTVGGDELPVSTEFFDEKGNIVRTMLYQDVRTLDGRTMPTTFMVVPADHPDEYTKIRYDDIDFDVDLPEQTFTLQALKQ
ncbi:MAG TPA: outer membrane lipoprotein-sorting protein [Myxococcota bacterium]|nr:outer membrane lipoprotein-sorting protein [Myxococcota bacterium]